MGCLWRSGRRSFRLGLRRTPFGRCARISLTWTFAVSDAAVHDTESRKALQDLSFEVESTQQSPGERVKLRGSRVELFLEYLMRCEERWVVEARRRDVGSEWQRQTVEKEIRPGAIASAAAALRSAERVYGPRTPPRKERADAATVLVDPKTCRGKIVGAWPDKDYVFIRGDDGTDWFSHRRDFVTDDDWSGEG